MSNTIDSRVVEMRFDNQQFESNVKTSMSTLDKLKSALRFDGATKGLEDINDAAKKVSFDPIGDGVDTVKLKFSALEVMAATALSNITTSALNAGKNVVKAFTLDPIMTGFQEYETQINAVQTILSNTQHNGTTLDEVNEALDELNHYADLTIYNFTEMTRNIGTFTAAGVDLKTSVESIKGIANLAAISGSTSQQASNAMYQLSQALAAGKVSLMDWNSVVNAGMGGKVFQDALVRTSELLGTGAQAAIDMYGSFRESLTKGEWLTTEVLTETLKQLSGAYSEADLIQQGFSKEQAKAIADMADNAVNAATKVKTFTQLIDTLKEAVQSGWTQSWEIIIGDFEEAKSLWTGVSDFFNNIIQKISDTRNSILETALGRSFVNIIKPIQDAIEPLKNTKDSIKELGKSLESLDSIADKVISGEFGNMQDRWSKLTEAGYDWIDVQNKVNEKLGISYRRTKENTDIQSGQISNINKQTDAQEDLNDSQAEYIESLTKMNRGELARAGYSSEQITAIRTLKDLSDKTGMSISELIDNIDNLNGRWLLLEGLKNIGNSIINVFKSIKEAWQDVFTPISNELKASKLFDAVANFYKISDAIKEFTENDDNVKKIISTLRGLFSILDIVRRILGAGLSIAIKLVSSVLDNFGLSILDVTAAIGDAVYEFRNWIVENDKIGTAIKYVADIITSAIKTVKEWINAFLEMPKINYIINNFGAIAHDVFLDFSDYLKGGVKAFLDFIDRVKQLDGLTLENIQIAFKDFYENVLGYFFNFDGKFKSLKDLIGAIGESLYNFVTSKITGPFKDALDIVGKFKDTLFDFITKIGTKLRDNVGMGEIFTMIFGGSLVYIMAKGGPVDTLKTIAEKVGEAIDSFKGVLDNLSGTLKGFTLSVKAKALLTIAGAIAVLAASIWVLCQIPVGLMWSAVGAITVLGGVLVGLSYAIGKINSVGDVKISATSIGALVGMAAAIGILVLAMKGLDTLSEDTLLRNIGIISLFVVELGSFAYVMAKTGNNISKGSIALISIATAVKIMVSALSDLDNLHLENIANDMLILLGIFGTLTLLSAGLSLLSNGLSAGVAIISMALSLKLIISALSDIADLRLNEIKEGLEPLKEILYLFMGIMAASALAGANAAKAGIGVLAMSASIYVLLGAFKLFAAMEASELEKAKNAISQMLIVFGIVTALSNFAGKYAAKAGVMLLLMAGAMVALTAVAVILSHIDAAGLNKAVGAMSIIMTIMGLLVACTGFAQGVSAGPFVAIAVTLGILMIALGALAMIDQSSLYSAVGAISIIMGMFAVVLAASKLIGEATKSIAVITVAIGLIGGVLIAMGLLDTENSLINAGAISTVMLAMAVAFKIIGSSGELATKALISLGIMTVIVGVLGAILWGMSALDVQNSLTNALGLSAVLLAISLACKIMQAIPIQAAITAAGSLAAFIFVLAGLMAGIFTVFGLIQDTSYIEHGIEVLSMIGYGLGEFVGSIIGGLADGVMSGLPAIGQHLTDFMTNLEGFINGVNDIKPESMQGAKYLAEAILMLCGAELINGITSFVNKIFKGDNDLGAFSEKISSFGDAMKGYANSVNGVDWSGIEPSLSAASKIVELAEIIPNSGGFVGAIVGNNDLDDFGTSLEAFADGLIKYANKVLGVDWSGVGPSKTAASKIIEVAEIIPNSGGLIGAIVGNNDLDDFGDTLEAFADGLVKYASKVLGVNWSGVDPSKTAANTIIDIAKTVPNSGGLVGLFAGNNDLDKFGKSIEDFAEGLVKYADKVTGVNWAGVAPSVDAVYKLNEIANNLPTKKAFDGKITLKKLGDQLEDFAKGFSKFAKKIESLDITNLPIAVDSITKLASLLNDVSGYDFSGTPNFVKALNNLGDASITAVVDAFQNGIDTVKTCVSNLCEGIRSTVADETFPICGQFTVMLDRISETIVNEGGDIAKAFNAVIAYAKDEIAKKEADFKTSGKKLIISLVEGINFGKVSIVNAIKLLVDDAISAISIDDFYNVGMNVAEGFANGIKDTMAEAERQSEDMAESTLDSAKETLDIHSPSRAFHKIGKYIVEGLALGIKDNAGLSYDAAKFVSNNLIDIVDKTASSMTYGSGAMKAYLKQYGKFTYSIADNNKVIKDASESIKKYAKALYEESDQYKEDTKKLEEDKKKLSELCAKREELRKQVNNSTKDAKKSATATNTVTDSINTSIESVNKITESATAKLSNFYEGAKDKITNFCDNIGINLGDLKTKFSNFCKDHNISLDGLISKYGSFENVITSGDASIADFVSELQPLNSELDIGTDSISSLNTELSTLDNEIEQAKNQVIEDEKAMVENTEKAFTDMRDSIKSNIENAIDFLAVSLDTGVDLFTKMDNSLNSIDPFSKFDDGSDTDPINILENMQSQINGVDEWKANIEELASRGLGEPLINYLKELGPQGVATVRDFMQLTGEELQRANEYYAQILTIDTTNYDILGTMQSQIDGVKEWKAQLEQLKASGLCDGLLKQLEEMGPEGADKVRGFLQLTAEELQQANSYYEESLSLSADQFLDNYAKKLNEQADWAEGLKQLAERNFDQGIIEALGEAGQESGQAYLDAFLAMSPEQIAEINEKYGKALTLPDEAADSIIATYIRAGEKSTDAYAESIDANSGKSEASAVSLSTKAAKAIIDQTKSKWTIAGANVVLGFMAGINGKTNLAQKYMKQLALKMLATIKSTLGIHSPSREFMKIGEYVNEGFANGIDNSGKEVINSISSLGENVISNAGDIITGVSDAVNGKTITSPTITPVINMDDISAEKLRITSNLDTMLNEPIESMTNVMATMQANIERSNDKVVSAISDLRNDMNAYYDVDNEKEIALYLDSKKMASTLAKPMSKQFNVLARKGI